MYFISWWFLLASMRSKPWLQKWSFLLYISFWFQQTAFTSKKDYGKEDRAAQWVVSQRSLQGYTSGDLETNGRRSSLIAEQARRRAEIARYYKLLFKCSLFTMTCFMIFYMDLIQSKLPGLQIFYPPDALAYSVDMWYIYIYIYCTKQNILAWSINWNVLRYNNPWILQARGVTHFEGTCRICSEA